MPKKISDGDDVIDDVTGWPQSFPLYSCLGEVGSGGKLQGQCLVNKCKYHNCLSRLYKPKDDLNEQHFLRLQVKGQHHGLTGWPWHLNDHNSINLGIIKMKLKNWNVKNSYSYVTTATMIRFPIWFHFQFLRSPDAAVGGLFGWLFNWKWKCSCRIISNIANFLKYNYFWDGDGIDNVKTRLWRVSDFCSRHTVGVAGDDIMFHILVINYLCFMSQTSILVSEAHF